MFTSSVLRFWLEPPLARDEPGSGVGRPDIGAGTIVTVLLVGDGGTDEAVSVLVFNTRSVSELMGSRYFFGGLGLDGEVGRE